MDNTNERESGSDLAHLKFIVAAKVEVSLKPGLIQMILRTGNDKECKDTDKKKNRIYTFNQQLVILVVGVCSEGF